MPLTNFPDGVDVKSLWVNGADLTTSITVGDVAGIAAGYILARGVSALDGTNPTPVVTGLTTVIAFTCTLAGTATPGVGTSVLTYAIAAGTVNVYAWKVTNSSTTTLIASTGTEDFAWIAIGV
jgi:hypothetical protein